MNTRSIVLGLGLILAVVCPLAAEGQWTGYLEGQLRAFPNGGLDPAMSDQPAWSVATELEYYRDWSDNDLYLQVKGFARVDSVDSERSYWDVRELSVEKIWGDWEALLGVSKVFWGVTESQHLVDIVNQTDLVEDPDEDEKLGQPMLRLNWVTDWGTWSAFVLTGFRERTFPGEDGRLRTVPGVAVEDAVYQSGAEEWHVDYALRWSHYWENLDWGLSYFYGTSRDPLLAVELADDGSARLLPVYNVMQQLGLDLQYTVDAWLWKFEGIVRSGKGQHYQAAVAGFEYTLYGLGGGDADLGLLAEFNFHNQEEGQGNTLDNDLFLGARLAMNDVDDTIFLGGPLVDVDNGSAAFRFELSRRLRDPWKLLVDGQIFFNNAESDASFQFRNEDFVQLQLRYYF